MTAQRGPSLSHAFAQHGHFNRLLARCPHCGTLGAFEMMANVSPPDPKTFLRGQAVAFLLAGRCPGCAEMVVGASRAGGPPVRMILWPREVSPDRAPSELEPDIKKAYDEAREILSLSPMAAAVLARRCLQHVIRHKLNIRKRTLFEEIQEAAKSDDLSKPTRQAIDHIREIGNWGAHPSESDSDPANTIIEVTPEEAEYTIATLEMCFHDLYVKPAEYDAMSKAIKAKK